ncbi:uncharacterized protein LOC106994413 [Macaca mulatta]
MFRKNQPVVRFSSWGPANKTGQWQINRGPNRSSLTCSLHKYTWKRLEMNYSKKRKGPIVMWKGEQMGGVDIVAALTGIPSSGQRHPFPSNCEQQIRESSLKPMEDLMQPCWLENGGVHV